MHKIDGKNFRSEDSGEMNTGIFCIRSLSRGKKSNHFPGYRCDFSRKFKKRCVPKVG
jgi:hypothetical protein